MSTPGRTRSNTLSPWQRFEQRWRNGCGSELCGGSDGLGEGVRVCLARGEVPAQVVFCAEAPGQSENVLGYPLCGPAGKLLDGIVDQAMATLNYRPSCAYCNLVGCFPKEAKASGDHQPPSAAIKKCSPRLKEFIELCWPRLIVCVGALAEKWIHLAVDTADPNIRFASIIHPAAILRTPIAGRGLAIKRSVVVLSKALQALCD